MNNKLALLEQEEGAAPQEEQGMLSAALQKARDTYGANQESPTKDSIAKMIARKMAEKGQLVLQEGETPEMAEARLAGGMEKAGEIGMQGGMSMGSIGNVANIGKHSQVARGLANEIGAAKKASNLMQLGAKAGDASKVVKATPKMSPEEMKALAQAMLKRGI
jgi:hypothetical protein